MNEDLVLKLIQDAMRVTAFVSAPILVGTLLVGLIVSIFQAITQINEASLSFIPKMIVVAIILVLVGPWMMDLMINYTTQLFENISVYVRE